MTSHLKGSVAAAALSAVGDDATPVPFPASSRLRVRRKGRDLRGADLRNRLLVGQDFQGADLRGADLRAADLRGANLYDARLDGADLRQARLDSARIVEIQVPQDLPLPVVNQIRAFDFRLAMTRFVGPVGPEEKEACPYRRASLSPILYEWGSRTWQAGRGWKPPAVIWTLEEIIAAVLDGIGCRHDLLRAYSAERDR